MAHRYLLFFVAFACGVAKTECQLVAVDRHRRWHCYRVFAMWGVIRASGQVPEVGKP
jgi:hypothetical protein